jgi:hypothetical protein
MGRKPQDWQEGLVYRQQRLRDGQKAQRPAAGAEIGAGKVARWAGSPKTSSRVRDWAGKAANWVGSPKTSSRVRGRAGKAARWAGSPKTSRRGRDGQERLQDG